MQSKSEKGAVDLQGDGWTQSRISFILHSPSIAYVFLVAILATLMLVWLMAKAYDFQ